MTPDASGGQAPTETNDVRQHAAGNLAFLLSVIRCGEQLSPDEEAVIRKTIARLTEAASASLDREGLADGSIAIAIVNQLAEAWDVELCGTDEADATRAVERLLSLRASAPSERESPTDRDLTAQQIEQVLRDSHRPDLVKELRLLLRATPRSEPEKTPERWALACKATVELIGRVNQGADLACEIAEALVTFPPAPRRDGEKR